MVEADRHRPLAGSVAAGARVDGVSGLAKNAVFRTHGDFTADHVDSPVAHTKIGAYHAILEGPHAQRAAISTIITIGPVAPSARPWLGKLFYRQVKLAEKAQ